VIGKDYRNWTDIISKETHALSAELHSSLSS